MSQNKEISHDVVHQWIRDALGLKGGDDPFPWQMRLFNDLKKGKIHRLIDIPTGLGKTGVMALWLVARAIGAPLPRRLVYIVDRRAVVDQATEVAMKLRSFVDCTPEIKKKLKLDEYALPISTLRGQFADNKEWRENPALPAIIVGTIDMIGSRLLFEGYGVSRKMRPYHAALLGTDTLVVLDEAHLVPPFEKLLETIADGDVLFSPCEGVLRKLVPSLKFMAMSATGRPNSGTIFSIDDADQQDGTVTAQRLNAIKRIVVEDIEEGKKLPEELAERAWKLTEKGACPLRIIVYCDKHKDAQDVEKSIKMYAKGNKKQRLPKIEIFSELLVGGRRIKEREDAAKRLKDNGFIASVKVNVERPSFLIATSAGEVGVDVDADHMVSDIVPWERMVQRLGRVNRLGTGDANIIGIFDSEKKEKDAFEKSPDKRTDNDQKLATKYSMRLATRELLTKLPEKNGARDGSPNALSELKQNASKDSELQQLLGEAITPAPLRPTLNRPLVDAWSVTSLKEHTGRPEIGPWLRGWIDDDKPRIKVVWRKYLPIRWMKDYPIDVSKSEIERFFEAARPHLSEVLETESFKVIEWLKKRAKKLKPDQIIDSFDDSDEDELTEPNPLQEDDIVAIVLTPAGDLKYVLKLNELSQKDNRLSDLYTGCTIILDARIGGLKDGLLDDKENEIPRTVDDGHPWMPDKLENAQNSPVVRFRVRIAKDEMNVESESHWYESMRFAYKVNEDYEPIEGLIIEKWRNNSETEDGRSTAHPQILEEHESLVKKRIQTLAHELNLPQKYIDMLGITACLHDEGKRANRWQQAFNAPSDGVYAKTKGPINHNLLDNYRHELGSLLVAEKDPELLALPQDIRELALHLITSHHGYARPVITTHGCDEAPPSMLSEKSKEIALRFARLQKQWGPWGLAWWETLLRASDQQASRDNEENGGVS